MATLSLQQILEIVRARPGVLPRAVAGHLYAAAVTRAAAAGASLRPGLVVIDPERGVLLDLAHEFAANTLAEAGYIAPEALKGSATADDQRVLVYAAGALGYHLLTTDPPPPPPVAPHRSLEGPVGEVVRVALSPDPRDRFSSLEKMKDALRAAHPALAPGIERQLSGAVLAVCSRWAHGDAPAARLRAAADAAEGAGGSATAAEVVLWARSADEALESLQRQQLELILALAVQGGGSGGKDGGERTARLQEQIDLLQRIATLAPAPPAATPGAKRAWLRWAGPIAASAAVAASVAVAMRPRPQPQAAPPRPPALEQPPAQAEAAAVPAEPEPAPAASLPERTIMASPVVLSAPNAGSAESAAEARQQPSSPQATRGPATPRPASTAPAKLGSRTPGSSPQDLLEVGERALGQGRAAEALAAFNAALDAQPDLAPAIRGTGLAYVMQGKNREAKHQLERYLQLAPRAEDAARMRKLLKSLTAARRSGR